MHLNQKMANAPHMYHHSLNIYLPLADITNQPQFKPEITSSDDFSTQHSKDH